MRAVASVSPTGRLAPLRQPAAEVRAGLEQGHRGSADGQAAGGLQAGRPGPDHDGAAAAQRARVLGVRRVCDVRVDRAAQRLAVKQAVRAVVDADTRADVPSATRVRQRNQLRLGDVGADHADQVGVAGLDQVVRQGQGQDPPDSRHGLGHHLGDDPGLPPEQARVGRGRRPVPDARLVAVVVADHHADVVDPSRPAPEHLVRLRERPAQAHLVHHGGADQHRDQRRRRRTCRSRAGSSPP